MGSAGAAAVAPRRDRHRSAIEDSLYAFGAEIESNAVEVYISRLRKKLGREFVHTSRGLGYQVQE
ncbi:MAG: winged helix-turn-helix domain-containing protein [Devosia sp.]|nr:winged helix-turn-helix domain-containing protein [Devosia sp.]